MNDNEKLLMANTIGMSILTDALKTASYMFYKDTAVLKRKPIDHPLSYQECSQSLLFVQGTGLEIMMDYYHIAYDADELRNVFFTIHNQRAYIE